jgi:hypothetical protein
MTLKTFSALAGLAAGFAINATGARAQSAVTQDINLVATVTSFCSINGTTTGGATAINAGLAANIGTTTTGSVSTAIVPISIGTITCNKGANIKLSTLNGAMVIPTAVVPGLQNYIGYSASTTGFPTGQASVSAGITTGAAGAGSNGTSVTTNASPFSVTGGVVVTPVGNASPLIAGTYKDILTLTVTPQ